MLSTQIINSLLFPPGINITLFILAALLGLFNRKKMAWFIAIIALLSLWLLATPKVSQYLLKQVEQYPPLGIISNEPKEQAIVVLGGGRYLNAMEFEGDDVLNAPALERIVYAAYLHRKTGLPIVVSGGSPGTNEGAANNSEAALMAKALRNAFHISAVTEESHSRTTYENAQFTKQLLEQKEIRSVYLVTHALHMTRSVAVFKHFGVTVTPAPTRFYSQLPSNSFSPWLDYLPKSSSLDTSRRALHEMLGLVWYRYRYDLQG